MKTLLIALALVPHFVFAGTIVLTLNAEQGISKLKVPGEILYESTSFFCEERGLTPQPWSAPKKQKVAPKVISQSDKSLVLEISTDPKKQDMCKYKFSNFTIWSDDSSFFVTLEGTTQSNLRSLDALDLELVANQNSLYKVDCLAKRNFSKSCQTYKDGIKKGYSSGNSGRLLVDVKKLDLQKEIRPVVEFKKRAE